MYKKVIVAKRIKLIELLIECVKQKLTAEHIPIIKSSANIVNKLLPDLIDTHKLALQHNLSVSEIPPLVLAQLTNSPTTILKYIDEIGTEINEMSRQAGVS